MAKTSEETIKVSEKFLLGDLLKAFWKHVKTMPVAYTQLPENDQEILIDKISSDGKEAVRQAVKIIAADDRPHISGDVESVTFKDGIKVTLKVSKDAAERLELADAVGTMVLIVLPNADKHLEGEGNKPTPDQGSLTD